MPSILRTIKIHAPVDAVWRVLAAFGDVGAWAPAIREAHCKTAAHSGLGCARSVTASNGRTVEEVVTRWDEGRSFTFEVPGGLAGVVGFLEEAWSVAPADAGTEVAVTMQYRSRLGPVGAAVARVAIRPALAKMLAANLAGLKRHVEAGPMAGVVRPGQRQPDSAPLGARPG